MQTPHILVLSAKQINKMPTEHIYPA
uniref:Uncharacterized protein n=1 Tax=Anguilla anguilla TaxID=7936 RepID=A0A0E9V3F1_ANGAN